MKVTWLGQAGLLFETNGLKIMVDPYLSDSVKKITPAFYRRVPVDQSLFDIKPDVIILTHNHLDHTDPETLPHFSTENSSVLVLASYNAWQTARTFKGNNNYVSFNRNTEWTEKGVRFKAVYAEHSDDHAIGVVIFAEDKTYYVTGDTLYNEKIFDDLPSKIDYVFLPVNGVGNNMNEVDAARFFKASGAKVAIPLHVGMFDEKSPDIFKAEPRVLPELYKEIKL
jgi:L-ascorbate metabolism protein UlaG (beta-lactamase superfamily)